MTALQQIQNLVIFESKAIESDQNQGNWTTEHIEWSLALASKHWHSKAMSQLQKGETPMRNKGADHLFGPGTAGGPDKDGGLPPGRAGAAAPRARAIKEWDSHGKSGGSQQLQDRRHKTGVYISS